MTPLLTIKTLFEQQAESLKLKWIAGHGGESRLLEPTNAKYPGMALVGHLNFVHPNRVQVIGKAELDYLKRLGKSKEPAAIEELCKCPRTTAVIVAGGNAAPAGLRRVADRHKLGLFTSPLPSPVLIDNLQYYLARALAPRLTVHGVYMEVMGMGVLITGESGIGKSELALELLSRNHRLIADDAVELVRVGPNILLGQCPGALSDYLEVRGLGILDVRLMFGETAVRHRKRLHLIVHLERLTKRRMAKIDRLQAQVKTRKLLDVDVPSTVLYVGAGRNLAVLVEAAVRNTILQLRGIDTYQEFIARHQRAMEQGDE